MVLVAGFGKAWNIVVMGQCDICSREGDYNAVDSEGLMRDIGDSELAQQIRQLRNDNR
jgi:hypothetical protein